jgi:hypothetical protein
LKLADTGTDTILAETITDTILADTDPIQAEKKVGIGYIKVVFQKCNFNQTERKNFKKDK